jgi:hypothetical protein
VVRHIAGRPARIDPAGRIRNVIAITAAEALAEAIAAKFDGFLGVPVIAEAIGRIEAACGIVAVAPVDALAEAGTSRIRTAGPAGQRFALRRTASFVNSISVQIPQTHRADSLGHAAILNATVSVGIHANATGEAASLLGTVTSGTRG